MQKINEQHLAYCYTTAPSLRTSPDGTILPIRLEIPNERHRAMILANLDGNAPKNPRFRSQLPQILASEESDWVLWNVAIYPQHVAFHFDDRSVPCDDAASMQEKSRPKQAMLMVRQPEELEIAFTVPELFGEPERSVKCSYAQAKFPGASGRVMQELWVIESAANQLQFNIRLRTPIFDKIDGRID